MVTFFCGTPKTKSELYYALLLWEKNGLVKYATKFSINYDHCSQ